jgi:amidase
MDWISLPARTVVDALRAGQVSPTDLLDALERRILAVDGAVGAFPTLCFDRARAAAERMAATPPDQRGPLAGLPVPIKDLDDVAGVRTTYGSPIYADHVPKASGNITERVEAAGGIVYGKSNTPEFGAGGHTFNAVFPPTRNPWNTALSAAGSSGGAAAALKSGTAWLAQGSDMGGSLRNPASFCGVVGLRPSPGRVPCGPSADPFDTLSVCGPMARDVDDCALFLDALTGLDAREPLSIERPATSFAAACAARSAPGRVAFGAGLGITPVDPEIADLCRTSAGRFRDAGAVVEETHPSFDGAHDAFQILRAHAFAVGLEADYRTAADLMKPDVVWNIEKGLALSSEAVRRARRVRGQLTDRVLAFMTEVDVLATPATIVPPFPVEWTAPMACAGQSFETYVDWLAIAYAVTLTGLPAISIPCGFTASGLPVGLQLVGKPRGEAALLSAAACLQDILGLPCDPIDPRPPREAP